MSISSNTPSEAAHAAELPPREWLRVSEAIRWSGISKPKLYLLINSGVIKSACLRGRGQVRGTRLISFDSLKDYIESCAEVATPQA